MVKKVLFTFLICIIFSGCSSVPKRYNDRIEDLDSRITNVERNTTGKRWFDIQMGKGEGKNDKMYYLLTPLTGIRTKEGK